MTGSSLGCFAGDQWYTGSLNMFSFYFKPVSSLFNLFNPTLVTMFMDWHLTVDLPFLPIIWFHSSLSRSYQSLGPADKVSDINVLSESIEGMRIDERFRPRKKHLTDEFRGTGNHLCGCQFPLFEWPVAGLMQLFAFFWPKWRNSGFTAGPIYAFIQYVSQPALIDVSLKNFTTDLNKVVSLRWWIETTMSPKQAGSLRDIPLTMYLFLMS